MAGGMADYEAAIAPVKECLFGELLDSLGDGQPHWEKVGGGGGLHSLLEVGIGTGPNFKYYSQASTSAGLAITGLDPNASMAPYAAQAASAAGFPAERLRLVSGAAEAMPFPDGAFDAAVVTLVLCSVPQPDAAVKEILRVLRPGGRLLFIEHVAAPQKRRLARLAQRVLDPLQQALADGCHLTRDTRSVLEGAGFSRLALEAFQLGGGMSSLIAPHVAGLGQK